MKVEQHIFHLVQAVDDASKAYAAEAKQYDRKCSTHTREFFTTPVVEVQVDQILFSNEFDVYSATDILAAIDELEKKDKIVVREENGMSYIKVKPL